MYFSPHFVPFSFLKLWKTHTYLPAHYQQPSPQHTHIWRKKLAQFPFLCSLVVEETTREEKISWIKQEKRQTTLSAVQHSLVRSFYVSEGSNSKIVFPVITTRFMYCDDCRTAERAYISSFTRQISKLLPSSSSPKEARFPSPTFHQLRW